MGNVANVYDGNENTYGSRLPEGTAYPIFRTPTNSGGGTISKVEYRIKGRDSNVGTNYMEPDYTFCDNGSGVGSQKDIDDWSLPSGSAAWSAWEDITDDTNAPGTGNWTWADVLDIRIKAYLDCPNPADFFDLYQIDVRVTSA
jgi:hypothetical protein